MDLNSDETKFLEDLITYSIDTSENWRKTLEKANIPLNQKFNETYSESFGPYQREEKKIIQGLFDRNILRVKVKQGEKHQSLDQNKKSKEKDIIRGLGIDEGKIDQLLEELGIEP